MAQIIAFFDMDRTVLAASSGVLYVRYLLQHGQANWRGLLESYWNAALYRLGLLNYTAVMAKLALAAEAQSETELIALCQRWFDDMGVAYIAPQAVACLDEHRAQGHGVTLISAATRYIVGPVAHHLGMDDYLCTQLEVIDGRFTGKIVPPDCYAANKITWARKYAQGHGADLADAYFYSDGYSDVPLLERVGHPVAVNPDRRLQAVAARRGWAVQRFYQSFERMHL